MKKIFLFVATVVLFFLALFPRSVELLNHNYLFLFDQGREYLAARNIVVNHKFILIGTELGAGSAGISGIFHGPVYYYLLTIPFILFRGDPYGGMLLMFLFSISAIIAGFFLGKKVLGFWFGIIAAFLFALSPPLISSARFIWSPNPPTVFIVVAFFFVYEYVQKRNNWALLWAAFFSGFVYNFEFALAIPMVLTIVLFTLFLRQKNMRLYGVLLAGLMVAFSPMLFFEARHNFQAVHGVLSYVFGNHAPSKTHQTFFNSVNSHWGAFISNAADTFPQKGFISGIFILLGLLLLPMWAVIKEKHSSIRYFIIYLLLLLPVNVIVFGFLRNTVYHYYLTDLTVAYIFLFTYCLYIFWQRKNFLIFGIFITFFMLLIFAGIGSAIVTYNHDIHDFGGTAKIKGLQQAYDYIYTDGRGKNFGLLVFAPPVYTYQYDYMEVWYGQNKYKYLPYHEKKGLVYLLIEPDPFKPWSYKGWLETVITTGTVLDTKVLPSGFLVQKRIFD